MNVKSNTSIGLSILQQSTSRNGPLAQTKHVDGLPLRQVEKRSNYALAWFDHYAITESPMVLEHFYRLRTALIGGLSGSVTMVASQKPKLTTELSRLHFFFLDILA